jgi:hypothetical protein
MRAFELYLNDKRLCLAGIGHDGVLTAIVNHVVGHGHNEMFLDIGGLDGEADEFVDWKHRSLKVGDEVRVKIVEAPSVDRPKKRRRRDRREELKREKFHVRAMAKEFGWKITTAKDRRPL